MKILFGVIATIFLISTSISIPVSVYAQGKYVNLTMDTAVLIPYGKLITDTQKYIDKLTLMEETCGSRLADRTDYSILPACTKFHEEFNQHMKNLFNETRNEMTQVLID